MGALATVIGLAGITVFIVGLASPWPVLVPLIGAALMVWAWMFDDKAEARRLLGGKPDGKGSSSGEPE